MRYLRSFKPASFRLLDFTGDVEDFHVKEESSKSVKNDNRPNTKYHDELEVSFTITDQRAKETGYYCLILPMFREYGDVAISDSLLAEMLSSPNEEMRRFASLLQHLLKEPKPQDDDEPPF